jgi:3-isopropylmalate/(R)-2-methylmalate dehydratase small subunit
MSSKVWKYGSNINTDVIYPGQYLNLSTPEEISKHCMEGIDKDFNGKVHVGDVIVAGENFGSGSSREHAPIAIKAVGISCVIAKSFARIFFRNAINIGLPIIECEEASEDIQEGHEVDILYDIGLIENRTINKSYKFNLYPDFIKHIISCGGLIAYTSQKIMERK